MYNVAIFAKLLFNDFGAVSKGKSRRGGSMRTEVREIPS